MRAELLAAYELGVLPEERRSEVEEHLLECDACFADLAETAPAMAVMRSVHRQRPFHSS